MPAKIRITRRRLTTKCVFIMKTPFKLIDVRIVCCMRITYSHNKIEVKPVWFRTNISLGYTCAVPDTFISSADIRLQTMLKHSQIQPIPWNQSHS